MVRRRLWKDFCESSRALLDQCWQSFEKVLRYLMFDTNIYFSLPDYCIYHVRSANHNHMMALLQQLLYSESLSLSWRDIIVPVVRQIVQTVRPDVRSCDDDMDIRQLVHIKKVGSRFFILMFSEQCVCDKRANLHISV